jgi:outer membrane protein TolC
VLAGSAVAQPLSEFLASAEQHNVDARLGAEGTRKASADSGKAWGGLLPSLTASGGYTYNEFPAVIPAGPASSTEIVIIPRDQLDATARVELPLLDATRWFNAAAAAASVDAAQARQGASLDVVRRQVVAAFYTVTGARAVLDSAQKSLKVAQAQLDFASARHAAGVATELELERARAELERNNQLVADAEALAATSARTLRSLTALEPGPLPPLPEDDLHPEPPSAELERRVETLPPVLAADADLAAAGRAWTAATLALVPSLNAQFTQRLTNATSFQGTPHAFNAGLTLSWRLDVPVVQTIRAQASAEASARLQAEKARLAAGDQIHADWQKVRAAVTKVKAARAQVAAARRAQQLATERYQAGVATQLDTIQTDRDVFSAEVNDIQARGELAAARLALRISAGLPLEVQP